MEIIIATREDKRKKMQVWDSQIVHSYTKEKELLSLVDEKYHRSTKNDEDTAIILREETRKKKVNPVQHQQSHAKTNSSPLTLLLEFPCKILVLPDLNMTCDIKRSCKVLMLSQPGRNTRIAPSYIQKMEWREKRLE